MEMPVLVAVYERNFPRLQRLKNDSTDISDLVRESKGARYAGSMYSYLDLNLYLFVLSLNCNDLIWKLAIIR